MELRRTILDTADNIQLGIIERTTNRRVKQMEVARQAIAEARKASGITKCILETAAKQCIKNAREAHHITLDARRSLRR